MLSDCYSAALTDPLSSRVKLDLLVPAVPLVFVALP